MNFNFVFWFSFFWFDFMHIRETEHCDLYINFEN